jgi:hypothetical protein
VRRLQRPLPAEARCVRWRQRPSLPPTQQLLLAAPGRRGHGGQPHASWALPEAFADAGCCVLWPRLQLALHQEMAIEQVIMAVSTGETLEPLRGSRPWYAWLQRPLQSPTPVPLLCRHGLGRGTINRQAKALSTSSTVDVYKAAGYKLRTNEQGLARPPHSLTQRRARPLQCS